MEKHIGFAATLLLVGYLIVAVASCSGTEVTPDAHFTPDPNEVPGIVGDVDPQPVQEDLPVAQIVEGASRH